MRKTDVIIVIIYYIFHKLVESQNLKKKQLMSYMCLKFKFARVIHSLLHTQFK